MVPTLPLDAVLVNTKGITLRFVDGSQTPQYQPCDIIGLTYDEWKMIDYARTQHGWVTVGQYIHTTGCKI